MEEFIKNNFGYLLGIILTPITCYIIKTIKGTFKSKVKKNDSKKHHKKRDAF